MSATKNTSQKKTPIPPVKRPFARGRSHSIDDILGDASSDSSAPGELGQAFLHATNPKRSQPEAQPSDESRIPVLKTEPPKEASSPIPLEPLRPAGSAVSESTGAAAPATQDGVMIPTSLIRENPKLQPRLRVDEDHVINLSEKFKAQGQLNAIIVRPTEVDGVFMYEIIGGNHRFRAAQRNGWQEIRCNIRDVSFEEARILAVDDNDSNLPTSDYEKALAYQGLLDDKIVANQIELSELFGLSRGRISQCLAFIALPPPVKTILNDHPDLFSYRTAMDIKKLASKYENESGEISEPILDHITAGVTRLIDGAPIAGMINWIDQRISGKTPFRSETEARTVTDNAGRVAFKTKAKPNAVVVEWEKRSHYSPEMVQDALLVALRTLAEQGHEQERQEAGD